MTDQDLKSTHCVFCGELLGNCNCPDPEEPIEIFDDSEPFTHYPVIDNDLEWYQW